MCVHVEAMVLCMKVLVAIMALDQAYLPKFDNKGHISTAPSFSFGDHDVMVRASRSVSQIVPQPSSRSLSRQATRAKEEKRRRLCNINQCTSHQKNC